MQFDSLINWIRAWLTTLVDLNDRFSLTTLLRTTSRILLINYECFSLRMRVIIPGFLVRHKFRFSTYCQGKWKGKWLRHWRRSKWDSSVGESGIRFRNDLLEILMSTWLSQELKVIDLNWRFESWAILNFCRQNFSASRTFWAGTSVCNIFKNNVMRELCILNMAF